MAQHDYVIDNGTGAAVRADLNSVLSAVASLNSGATAPSTTFAHMWWMDTATNQLKKRDGANTGWIIVATFDDGDGNMLVRRSADMAVTAAGTVQGDATAFSVELVRITAGGADTGIIPDGIDQVVAEIMNATASAKILYPMSGGAVDGGTTNVGVSIPAGLPIRVFIDGADLWVL
jgi:hypothetical protein